MAAEITKLVVLSELTSTKSGNLFTEMMDKDGLVWSVYVDQVLPDRYKSKIIPRAIIAIHNGYYFKGKKGNGKNLMLKKESKVISCPANTLDVEAQIEAYLNPPTVPARDALSSPSKTRMTVTATVTKVYDKQTAPDGSWSRQDLTLEPSIKLKLWNGKASGTQELEGKLVTFHCVEVDQFNGAKCLQSTHQTSYQVLETASRRVTIIAANTEDDELDVELLTEEGEVITTDNVTCPVLPELPCFVNVSVDELGNTVVQLN